MNPEVSPVIESFQIKEVAEGTIIKIKLDEKYLDELDIEAFDDHIELVKILPSSYVTLMHYSTKYQAHSSYAEYISGHLCITIPNQKKPCHKTNITIVRY